MLKRDYITYKMGVEYYGFGMKPFTRMVHESGAVFKIGKMVRINRHIFEAYLRENRAKWKDKLWDIQEKMLRRLRIQRNL